MQLLKKNVKSIRSHIIHAFPLFLLSCYALFLRIVPTLRGNFSFQFDNAKDSLVMLEMYLYHKPALLGPATSLPGVSQAPFMYYLFLPFNIIGGFYPYSSVIAVLCLVLISIWACWKYFGKFTAIVFSCAVGSIALHMSAWSPYLTAFPTLGALILLTKIKSNKTPKTIYLCLLSFFVSLLFHLEIAFGIVFLPLTLLVLLLKQIKPNMKQVLLAVFVFLLSVSPWIMFEFRHQFLQTHSIAVYLQTFRQQSQEIGQNSSGVLRTLEVGRYAYENFSSNVLPIWGSGVAVPFLMLIIVYLLRRDTYEERKILLPIILGTCISYLFLPVKSFYFVGLLPFWIYALSKAVHAYLPRFFILLIVVGYLLLSAWTFQLGIKSHRTIAQGTPFFQPKYMAIKKIYAMSEGKPFASYHYVPEIYDYQYQLIYMMGYLRGKTLPTEFSYAPGETTYIPQKHVSISKTPEAYVMLIVEKPVHEFLFNAWWGRVASNLQVIEKVQINDAITVYKTIQK